MLQPIETMTLRQLDATIAKLRAQKKALKTVGIAAQQKIATLERRRARVMQQVEAVDAQITQLRGELPQLQPRATAAPRHTRRRQADVTQCLDAIMDCVKRHAVTQRATIIAECHLSPATASAYLRQLCQEGRLIRHGEKRVTTYELP